MRIISGIYKSRRFALPKNLDARPTTDFAKENIFNVIRNLIDLEDAVALDLFAGTGSIGFELISRGCREVVSVEKNRLHYRFICKVALELHTKALKALNGDVFKYLENCRQSFDLIFADPPYALPDLKRIPELILSGHMLNGGGVFIMEHPKEYDFSHLPGFRQHRSYGSVNFSVFSA
ncbi:MAG: RsmD family RNA methyltransferase [Dysgonamonadaceae bacterium]|jgi:16S rRNA (guanine(966)-N(2))-methyltransferase RsmD|nr:RsmD family RNA methyltransferase [Dysgonamonadaceae bacterium]